MGNLQSLVGVSEEIGSHHFDADEIIHFARKYDPQPFHVDAEAARRSHFGALCASGWHSISMWMSLNVDAGMEGVSDVEEWGPLSGFRDLRWLRPVYAGDTIRYRRTIREVRPETDRPGWTILTIGAEGHNQDGVKVMECEIDAPVRLAS